MAWLRLRIHRLLCYADEVKCNYIDPPYNTDLAFEHYDDRKSWMRLL